MNNKRKKILMIASLIGLLSTACSNKETKEIDEKVKIEMVDDTEELSQVKVNNNEIMAVINTDLREINDKAYVINDTSLYEGPDTNYKVIRSVSKNHEVKVLANSASGWLLVEYNNKIGFINTSSLDLTSTIMPQTYNLGPINKSYKIICLKEDSELLYNLNDGEFETIPKYECGKVFNETENYYLIETENTFGYIPKESAITLDGTFVIVDISNQKLELYEDNEITLTSDIVSGRPKHETDLGIESIQYKQRNRTLVGRGYRSFVKYWMRINGNAEGLHDASWRSEFGGNIYKSNGSHGCVNLPTDTASTLYDKLEVGDKVIVKK